MLLCDAANPRNFFNCAASGLLKIDCGNKIGNVCPRDVRREIDDARAEETAPRMRMAQSWCGIVLAIPWRISRLAGFCYLINS